MSVRPCAAGRALAGALLLSAPTAAAAPGSWVRWSAPPVADASPGRAPTPTRRSIAAALTVTPGATCLSAETLAEHVPTWLGRDEVDVGVRIEVRGDVFARNAATLTVQTPAGLIERSFEDGPPGCSDLHAVLGLAIAMAIDASVLTELGYQVVDEPPPPTPAVDSERPPLLTRRAASEPTPRRRGARLRAIAGVRGGLWVGMLPGLAGGGQLHVELGWRPWFELRLGALGGYGGRRPLGGGMVEFGLVAGRVDACFGVQRRRLRPRLCLGPAVGALQAVGSDFPVINDVVSPYVAATLALELRIMTTSMFALDVTLDGVVPFIKPLVQITDPNKASMIRDAVNLAPVGLVIAVGGAFTIR